jgi:hypothetical protein
MEILYYFKCRLSSARRAKGWTYYRAAQYMKEVRPQQLRNLEGKGGNPLGTHPGSIRLDTALEILRAFWPDLELEDFAGPDCPFRIVPRDKKAARRLKGYESP